MATFKCITCAAELEITEGMTVCVCKICGTRQTIARIIPDYIVPGVVSLLKRGYMALEDGEWDKADGFFEEVLNRDAENAEAYLGKLLAELKLQKKEDLAKQKTLFEDNKNYQRFERFASLPLLTEISGYVYAIRNSIENELIRQQKEEEFQKLLEDIAAAINYHTVKWRRAAYKKELAYLHGLRDAAEEEECKEYLMNKIKRSIRDTIKKMCNLPYCEECALSYEKAIGYFAQEKIRLAFAEKYPEVSHACFGKDCHEWLVLDVSMGKALLLSKYAVEKRAYQYDVQHEYVEWETCYLRKWLNHEYLETTFNASERGAITATALEDKENERYESGGGHDTVDKVFLLSVDEVLQYFPKKESRIATLPGGEKVWWWLRSSTNARANSMCVADSGDMFPVHATFDSRAVRPAMWVDISQL